jgi:ankyrin repeat protein
MLNIFVMFVGSTALHLACINGLEQVVKLLVQKGAAVSAADINGYSALQVKLLTVIDSLILIQMINFHLSEMPAT